MVGLKIPSFTSWRGLSGDQQYSGATQELTVRESPVRTKDALSALIP